MATNVTFDEFRNRMNDYRDRLVRDADMEKEMNLVPIDFEKQYSTLNDNERLMADRVVCEWLLSEDSGTRWIAQFLIKKIAIRSAINGLKQFESRLQRSASVYAPDRDELAKVRNLIETAMG